MGSFTWWSCYYHPFTTTLIITTTTASHTQTNRSQGPANETWMVGITKKSVSVVSSQGLLKSLEFITTSDSLNDFIFDTILQAIKFPRDVPASSAAKPKEIYFLNQPHPDTALSARLAKIGIKVTATKPSQPSSEGQKSAPLQQLPQEQIQFNAQPNRGCISCHQEIIGKKPSQCSACKAVIYCSSTCAKDDWKKHKTVCKEFKTSIDHIKDWNLHQFPFNFYTPEKVLR